MLRREGYSGRITMLSADASIPCDRPNLSKGYLAGTAPASSNSLRSLEFYRQQHIDLKLNARVARIDAATREVILADGSRHAYDALLLATGAEPVRLDIPGSDLPHVHYLRTLADGEALVSKALVSQHAVVIGASFIGLEVAASLRARNIDVHVVAPDAVPPDAPACSCCMLPAASAVESGVLGASTAGKSPCIAAASGSLPRFSPF